MLLRAALRRVPRTWPTTYHSQRLRWASNAPATSAATQLSIREAFADIRNSISLVNQGERLKVAQAQVHQLSKELEVNKLDTYDYCN